MRYEMERELGLAPSLRGGQSRTCPRLRYGAGADGAVVGAVGDVVGVDVGVAFGGHVPYLSEGR